MASHSSERTPTKVLRPCSCSQLFTWSFSWIWNWTQDALRKMSHFPFYPLSHINFYFKYCKFRWYRSWAVCSHLDELIEQFSWLTKSSPRAHQKGALEKLVSLSDAYEQGSTCLNMLGILVLHEKPAAGQWQTMHEFHWNHRAAQEAEKFSVRRFLSQKASKLEGFRTC